MTPRSRPSTGRASRYVALSGTPGTGKSSAARALRGRVPAVEVGALAVALGVGVRSGHTVTVDLSGLAARMVEGAPPARTTLLVGHLAHLLPVREVLLLRCHPRELLRRLRRARRGRAADRAENAEAEAIDLLLAEARGRRLRVQQIDTTGRPPSVVADLVLRSIRRPGTVRSEAVDWLADPGVTRSLFRPAAYPSAWSSRGTGGGRPRTSRGSPARSSGPRRTA